MLTHRRPSACARRRLAGLETPAPMAPAGRGGGSRPDPARPLASPHTTPNSHSHATHTHTRSRSHSHSHSHSRTTHLEHARPSRRHMPVCLACKVAWTLAHVTNIPPPPPMLVFTLHTCYPPHHHLRACVRALVMYVKASHRAAVRKWSRPVPREAEAALPSPHACCAPCCEVVRLLDGGISDPRVESHPTSRIIDSSTDTIKQNKTILQAGHG